MAAGTLLGWTSPTEILVVTPDDNKSFVGEYPFTIDKEEWSWVGSSATLGAAVMVFIIGTVVNILGRKNTMLLLIVPFVIGWALVIWAVNLPMLLVGRVMLGIAGGSFCITAPMYTAEIAQKEIRGSLGSYFQLMLTVGILFVYAVGAGVSVFVLSIICGIIPLLFGAIFVFMPETPYYLISKNRTEDAIKSLQWLRGSQYDYTQELAEMQAENEHRKKEKIPMMQIFTSKATVRALYISFGLMVFQQMSGINAVIFYTTIIFDEANVVIDPSVATIIVGVMQVIATFVSTMVVDKLGRRILLLMSVSIMGLCTILLGVFFYLSDQNKDNVADLGWLPIVSMCIFIVMFSLGFGPIPWMMIGEIFAPEVKGIAGSAAGSFNWILAFVITKTFTNMRDAMGTSGAFWLFSAFSIVGTVFVFFVIPETKGKTLSEIQKLLAGEKENKTDNSSGVVNAKL